jgi:predicted component of type VI protein secretion system
MLCLKKISVALAALLLSACTSVGFGSASQTSSPSPVARNASFNLTLLGGSSLNMTGDGVARPVQVCIYVVKNRAWEAPLLRQQSSCVEPAADANVLLSRRVISAPLHMNHLSLPMSGLTDVWLIIDADFSQPAPDHSPYVFLINGKNNQLHVMLNGNELFQNKLMGQEPVYAASPSNNSLSSTQPTQGASSSELQRFKPLVRQSVMNPSSINIQQQGQGMLWDEISKAMDGKR